MNKSTKERLIVISSIPVIFAAYIYGSYVATVVWGWFMVEPFGLPEIAITHAMGFGLIIAIFTTSFARRDDLNKIRFDDDDDAMGILTSTLIHAFSCPSIILGIGWIVRQFM